MKFLKKENTEEQLREIILQDEQDKNPINNHFIKKLRQELKEIRQD